MENNYKEAISLHFIIELEKHFSSFIGKVMQGDKTSQDAITEIESTVARCQDYLAEISENPVAIIHKQVTLNRKVNGKDLKMDHPGTIIVWHNN